MPHAEHTTDKAQKTLPVHDSRSTTNSALLSLCALLRWFDRDLLRELSGCDESEIEALLKSDNVTQAHEQASAYCLQDGFREEVLARLRANHPPDELTLHTRV